LTTTAIKGRRFDNKPIGAVLVPVPFTITGFLRVLDRGNVGELTGVVRLEDVSLIDAPSRIVASASVFVPNWETETPFLLQIDEEVSDKRSYLISALLEGSDVRTGQRHKFGTTASHSWQLGSFRTDIEVRPRN
jgi:hypothetical protein